MRKETAEGSTMKRNTRLEILITAKKLFNERGYNAVSTRDIADAAGIAKGNLTYYFQKKEEIIEAVLEETINEYFPGAPGNLKEMDAFLRHMQEMVQDNAFYFWHHAQLSRLSPKIRSRQSQVYQSNLEKLAQTFVLLRKDGVIREAEFSGEYDRVMDALLLSIIYWMPFRDLKQYRDEHVDYRIHAWCIMRPLLTEKGQKILKGIITFE